MNLFGLLTEKKSFEGKHDTPQRGNKLVISVPFHHFLKTIAGKSKIDVIDKIRYIEHNHFE